jgi:hypothetical protein
LEGGRQHAGDEVGGCVEVDGGKEILDDAGLCYEARDLGSFVFTALKYKLLNLREK